jgi:cellulose synthase/poly-beta-1,6-N-acetylglucosamine synthase-like glycosyltransferase
MCLVCSSTRPCLIAANTNSDSVPEFISQRRRWLNGAFFAAVYSLLHFRQVWYTDHTVWRKILLHIEFVYQFVSLLFTFFSLVSTLSSNFFSIVASNEDPGQLLSHILLHRWFPLRSQTGSIRPWNW